MSSFTQPRAKAKPPPHPPAFPMSIVVLCNSCLAPFDVEHFAGLLRCERCSERASFRLPGTSFARVVVL